MTGSELFFLIWGVTAMGGAIYHFRRRGKFAEASYEYMLRDKPIAYWLRTVFSTVLFFAGLVSVLWIMVGRM